MSEAQQDDEQKRVTQHISTLSTQLLELVDKQSQLEDQITHSKRENERLKKQLLDYENIKVRFKTLETTYRKVYDDNQTIRQQLLDETKAKNEANSEVEKLQKEVEDLTASLFDEANKMVSDARKEAHDYIKRNENLIIQLKGKDLLMNDLQTQLKELKESILDKDDLERSESQISTDSISTSQPIIFSPTVTSVRYDLKLFAEFKKFIQDLDKIESIKDTETKFLKKLISDDIDHALKLDDSYGISWLNRRPLMSAIIEGRVVIEPVSGINETYRLNSQTASKQESSDTANSNLYAYPVRSPPVAINQPCAICGESRDDILEHSRLHLMKVHAKENSTQLNTASYNTYPLCSYCLFRVRSTCELFAFLRSLKSDVWKLNNETMIKKAWIELSRLRSRLFWSKVGIWDIESNIITTKITSSSDDAIYKSISDQNDPASRLSHHFNESVESLPNPQDSADSLGSKYKASPLSNEMTKSPVKNETRNSNISDTKKSGAEDNSGDLTAEILADYSQDEAEDEEEHDDTIIGEVEGLKIDTDSRSQNDFLVDSNVSTPKIDRGEYDDNKVAETPFVFEKTYSEEKESEAEDEKFVDA
ncbi:hypothetical protein WICMUC_003748 [Wickerhamomyces mucosus]|uniref:GDP/GTP exchange factor Sec2 N-terminal domain-containing protein n=1 Tax=Wickerhamomyces mucosus TaxID=1378264 RepID=A0A9P8PJ85_9ASCO|nr:hypothetical protein WICMUC_003748 [Wickerhamomyces mucosus]